MDNFFAFMDKILPLLSTLLGAFITYYVTVLSKKNEIKVNAQTKARDEYWIPCSMAISNLQKKITFFKITFTTTGQLEGIFNQVLHDLWRV